MRSFYDSQYTRTDSLQCDYHGAVRVRRMDLNTGGYVISLVILNKEGEQYQMKFYYDIPFLTNIFQIHKMRRWPHASDVIMSLDFHPDLTPENAPKKLPTMILFS